jgi:branched-chain amino acid transport system ATP-binding protein
MSANELIRAVGVTKRFGALTAVNRVDYVLRENEIAGIIGSNGAGKTTLFRALCGMLPVSAGRVRFDGEDITGRPAHRVARAGLAYVPAERHLFPGMSVRENLLLGAYPGRPDPSAFELVLGLFPRLEERRKQPAGSLSGGEQQMLAVGRALMSRPRLLMLDEPTTGLAPKLARSAYEALQALKETGVTLLVAEQQVPLALSLADRGYVLETGRIRLEGASEDLERNPEVRRAYLGVA